MVSFFTACLQQKCSMLFIALCIVVIFFNPVKQSSWDLGWGTLMLFVLLIPFFTGGWPFACWGGNSANAVYCSILNALFWYIFEKYFHNLWCIWLWIFYCDVYWCMTFCLLVNARIYWNLMALMGSVIVNFVVVVIIWKQSQDFNSFCNWMNISFCRS